MFILPFDHRSSFRKLLPDRESLIGSYKQVIYDAFQKALDSGVPKSQAGILVDEEYGADILRDAKTHGFITACAVEKSGQEEFQFEYGEEFGAHIHKFRPTFAKALVRYDPTGDSALNRRQLSRIGRLSGYCQAHPVKMMLELLTPPELVIRSISEMQNFGIEPDIWKLEGTESESDCRAIASQARSGGRDRVGLIVLGRGDSETAVRARILTAARVPGWIGFAIGRTVFWNPLVGVRDERWSREKAAEMIAQNFKGLCDLWLSARPG